MNTDIRLAVSFLSHRKRKKLQKRLGAEGVLAFIDLLLSSAMHRPKGIFYKMTTEDIALDAQWEGDPNEFVTTLLDVGFLATNQDGEFYIHDWDVHNSFAAHADERSEQARRAVQVRWKKEKGEREYEQYTKRIRSVENSNTPSPSPTPIPIQEENNASQPKNKQKPPADQRVRPLVDFFHEQCVSVRGFTPTIDSGDAATVRRALNGLSEQEVMDAIQYYLKSDKANNCGVTLKAALSTHSLNIWKQGKEAVNWRTL